MKCFEYVLKYLETILYVEILHIVKFFFSKSKAFSKEKRYEKKKTDLNWPKLVSFPAQKIKIKF